MSKRLDALLVEKKLVKSRERAKELIQSGSVAVDGITAVKPAQTVSEDSKLEITGEVLRYVGRGGLKLEKALQVFSVSVEGKVCADIGASTGGFTDCMLQNGARKVYAIDVGHDQLDESLRMDSRVMNLEKTNIRKMALSTFLEPIELVCVDVSFISLRLVFPKIYEILGDGGDLIALIKPQFEAGRQDVGKNGIVKSPKVHKAVLQEILRICGEKFAVKALDFSPVFGGDGNIEYLIHAQKGGIFKTIAPEIIIEKAFHSLKGG